MAINSKKKGASGERAAVRVVKTWTKKAFSRVPQSGGLNWHNSQSTGDIICTTEGHYFPFTIEVKFHAKVDFSPILYKPKNEVFKFWDQTLRDSQRVNKVPMLMMRYNNLPKDLFFIAIPRDIYHKFFRPHMNKDQSVMIVRTKEHDLVIITSWVIIDLPYKTIRKDVVAYLKTIKP